MGILRRAFERGKALPKKLERALKIQAGLALPDGQITDIDAYHINQRDEGIDLQGVSGALMATSNMQMQTFVTQASENTEGFDGYNGDLTGDVAATLGVNCGMSTGRNGVIAFAANQRDEVRDLHDVAGALNAQPGIKQQTFVAGFSAGAGASAGSIGYHESVAPTLKAGASGNCMPSVLCINDQGGQVMEISEGMTGTLRAQEHGHQPLVYENHGKSLKSTLTPIIGKLSDMRIVAAELDYLMYEPFKEFITMAFLLVGNIPLLYFLNKDWYNVLVNTGFGKGILAVCLLVLLISFAAVIRLTKPVEYKR